MGGVYPCQEQRDLQNESRIDWMLSKKYLATPCTSISCYTISCYAIFYSVRLKSSFKEQSSLALVFAMRMSLCNVQSSLAVSPGNCLILLQECIRKQLKVYPEVSREIPWYERMNSTDTSVQDLVVLVLMFSFNKIDSIQSSKILVTLIDRFSLQNLSLGAVDSDSNTYSPLCPGSLYSFTLCLVIDV